MPEKLLDTGEKLRGRVQAYREIKVNNLKLYKISTFGKTNLGE